MVAANYEQSAGEYLGQETPKKMHPLRRSVIGIGETKKRIGAARIRNLLHIVLKTPITMVTNASPARS